MFYYLRNTLTTQFFILFNSRVDLALEQIVNKAVVGKCNEVKNPCIDLNNGTSKDSNPKIHERIRRCFLMGIIVYIQPPLTFTLQPQVGMIVSIRHCLNKYFVKRGKWFDVPMYMRKTCYGCFFRDFWNNFLINFLVK